MIKPYCQRKPFKGKSFLISYRTHTHILGSFHSRATNESTDIGSQSFFSQQHTIIESRCV